MIIPVKTENGAYNIYLARGGLGRAGEYLNLERRVLIVTDSGVPAEYVKTVATLSKEPFIVTVDEGERSKNIENYTRLLSALAANGFTRTDCVVAVGGGVVGDLAGFAAASYMRGIDFVGIPTTTLSQIDSSVGGKMAINLNGVKNIIGAFHQPKAVLIDFDVLATLPARHYANGLAEAVKMGFILDEKILMLFEREDFASPAVLDEIILRAVAAKAHIVHIDETEQNERKSLNFGHTIGHGIEAAGGLKELYHGECVALGMLYFFEREQDRQRCIRILKKLHLPTSAQVDAEAVFSALTHDKKGNGKTISVVKVPAAGQYKLENMSLAAIRALL